jgi:hypothetical protein
MPEDSEVGEGLQICGAPTPTCHDRAYQIGTFAGAGRVTCLGGRLSKQEPCTGFRIEKDGDVLTLQIEDGRITVLREKDGQHLAY